jgi:hypothetical protein
MNSTNLILFGLILLINYINSQEIFQFNRLGDPNNQAIVNINCNLYLIELNENICQKSEFLDRKLSVIIIGAGVSVIYNVTYLRIKARI